MTHSPIHIIFEMVAFLIQTIIATFQGIFQLFGSLLESLGIVASIGGPLGFSLSIFILFVVGYLVGRFLFGGAQKLLFLFIAMIFLIYIMLLGAIV